MIVVKIGQDSEPVIRVIIISWLVGWLNKITW